MAWLRHPHFLVNFYHPLHKKYHRVFLNLNTPILSIPTALLKIRMAIGLSSVHINSTGWSNRTFAKTRDQQVALFKPDEL
jgi:hypothetical protein